MDPLPGRQLAFSPLGLDLFRRAARDRLFPQLAELFELRGRLTDLLEDLGKGGVLRKRLFDQGIHRLGMSNAQFC